MKTKMILFTVATLFLLMGGMGCEKELSETELMKQKIAGKWEWIVSYQPGIMWKVTPVPGEKRELTITDNRVLATHNMEIINEKPVITDNRKVILEGNYIVSKEQDKFYIKVTPKEGSESLHFLSNKSEFSLEQDTEKLIFSFSQGTAQFAHIYRRVNE